MSIDTGGSTVYYNYNAGRLLYCLVRIDWYRGEIVLKKFLAVFLSLVIFVMAVAPASAMTGTSCDCDEVPIIYVRGRSPIRVDKDEPDGQTMPYVPDGFVENALKELVPVYTKGYLTDDFSEFKTLFTKYMAEAYKDFALDNNGEVPNNSGYRTSDYWKNNPIYDIHKPSNDVSAPEGATTELYKYFYQYDCRLDPCEIADDLHEYIQAVKNVTGHSRIKVLARCLGTTIFSAYLAEYGWDDIDDVVLYNPICFGTEVTNSLFNGEFYFDADAVDFFANQNLDDTLPYTLLKEVITLSNKTYGLGLTMDYFNKTAPKVAKYVIPDVLRVSYGTTPGYWSMVSADRFEEARDYVFAGVEEEYAGLIKKINYFHETVGSKLTSMYKQMEADGVNVSIIAKYGYQLYPIVYNADQQSDMIATCEQQAPGTITAPLGSKLSNVYLAKAKLNGTYKYISSDRAVDASTTLFPNTTWYIQNMKHNCYPRILCPFIYRLLRHDGEPLTVFSNENYPQYIIYEGEENNGDSIRPMTVEDEGNPLESPSLFTLIKNIIINIFKIIIEQFGKPVK